MLGDLSIAVKGIRFHLIPKNAHSAIAYALEGMEQRRVSPLKDSNDYRFMVVRHPLDRIVSSWAFFTVMRPEYELHDQMKILGYTKPMTFDDYLENLLVKYEENNHTMKQIHFTGGHKIDELCPIEQLSERWIPLAKRFGLGSMKKVNASKRSQWENYFTGEQRERAEATFKEDLKLYNLSLEK